MGDDLNRQWRLAHRPKGMVKESDFSYHESLVPEPADGQFLVRNLYLGFDPAMRMWMTATDRPGYVPHFEIGDVIRAACVGQVVASRHPAFQPGDFVRGSFGWQDYAVTTGEGMLPATKLDPGMPLTMPLSVLGITGLTAYFGLLDIGRPRAGDTVVVSGAAGATGSVAGQIAKILGCRVIGVAGGREKCDWLTREAGFDAAIDYQNEPVHARLRELCPAAIDVFFDNVGGEVLEAALAEIAKGARVVLCGGISLYNAETWPPGPRNYLALLSQRARMEGFMVLDFAARFAEAERALSSWVAAGSLTYREDIQEGFENAPKTLLRLFEGKNFGKQLLRIAEPPLGGSDRAMGG